MKEKSNEKGCSLEWLIIFVKEKNNISNNNH